jgi:hypothetical protein
MDVHVTPAMGFAINTRELSDAIEKLSESKDETANRWDAIGDVTEHLLEPLVAENGYRKVLDALIAQKDDPYIAAVLVNISGLGSIDSSGRTVLSVSDVFTDEEIVDAAVAYLRALPDASLGDGQWAWTALGNLWDQFGGDDQLRLLLKVIDEIPWDEDIMWMIADGPFASAAADQARIREMRRRAESTPKLARIIEIAEEDAGSAEDAI